MILGDGSAPWQDGTIQPIETILVDNVALSVISINGERGDVIINEEWIDHYTNDAYLKRGLRDKVSELINDAEYISKDDNVSELVNDAEYVSKGDKVSDLTNDAEYISKGDNVSELVNDAGYITGVDFGPISDKVIELENRINIIDSKNHLLVDGFVETDGSVEAEYELEKKMSSELSMMTLGFTQEELNNYRQFNDMGEWIDDQIASSFDNSTFSEWKTTGDVKTYTPMGDNMKYSAGWWGENFVSARIPDGWYTDGASRTNRGNSVIQRRLIHQCFIGNAPSHDVIKSKNRKIGEFKDIRKSFLNKCTYALHKFLVCSDEGGAFTDQSFAWEYGTYFTLLSRHAFRTYEELLVELAYSFSMASMLTHYNNKKTVPDENFGRELMQLFTIGTVALNMNGTEQKDTNGNPIENYTNEDVATISRVFTGLTRYDLNMDYSDPANESEALRYSSDMDYPYFFDDETFDGVNYPPGVNPRLRHFLPWFDNGEKQCVPKKDSNGNDIPGEYWVIINAGTDDNIEERSKYNVFRAINHLISHPSTPPFVAKNLITHSTTHNPSPEYVRTSSRGICR